MNKNRIGKKRWLLLLFCLYFQIAFSYGGKSKDARSKTETLKQVQSKQKITGMVTYDKMPMEGVTITVKGKNITTFSGTDGKYSIEAESGDALVFSFMGFKTVAVVVDNRSVISVALQEDATTLKEVTVNAGYYTVKEKERTEVFLKLPLKILKDNP